MFSYPFTFFPKTLACCADNFHALSPLGEKMKYGLCQTSLLTNERGKAIYYPFLLLKYLNCPFWQASLEKACCWAILIQCFCRASTYIWHSTDCRDKLDRYHCIRTTFLIVRFNTQFCGNMNFILFQLKCTLAMLCFLYSSHGTLATPNMV